MQKPISVKIDKFTFINYEFKNTWYICDSFTELHIGVNLVIYEEGSGYRLWYNWATRTQLELSIIDVEAKQFFEKFKLMKAFE